MTNATKNIESRKAMTDNIKKPKDVTVAKAKGRPMLTWVGKKPLARVRAYPAQAIERFDAPAGKSMPLHEATWTDWPKDLPQGGLLYHGDNKDVLAHLLANGFRGKVKLIYIDPPFDSGADYVRKVQLRGAKGTVKIDGEDYTLGEQVQYSDIWANDNYLQFMYERLLLLRELLRDDGAIFLHVDARRSHQLQVIMDEVFGQECFQNSISWKRTPFAGSSKARANRFPVNHDSILFYSKSKEFVFRHDYLNYSEDYLKRFKNPDGDPKGPYRITLLKSFSKERFEEWEKEGRLIAPKSDNAYWSYKQYLADSKGVQADDFWDDVAAECDPDEIVVGSMWADINLDNPMSAVRTDYPTQKPEALLERILTCMSSPGDTVLDCFVGSGTTAAVAQRISRRWIGCDINKGSIQTTAKRIQDLMRVQVQEAGRPQQGDLIGTSESSQKPSQLSFATYRVNDYDLQIQHNEAVELACQHLGVTRTRTDSFFEGTQGGRLVKIVPFNHPLTPLDLEAVRNELKTRPTEERDVMVVCLGWQHDARAWVESYNRNRPVNKLHVVELRTDRKLGGIIKHEPLTAEVSAERTGKDTDALLVVEVQDVVSPTIMQRLNLEQGVFRAQISDWRAVVDCILIDTQYDGQVFNVALADVPERKQDLVNGRYELPASPAGSTVAVKIIDMLGEELIVTVGC